jgi:hypothetical protein
MELRKNVSDGQATQFLTILSLKIQPASDSQCLKMTEKLAYNCYREIAGSYFLTYKTAFSHDDFHL